MPPKTPFDFLGESLGGQSLVPWTMQLPRLAMAFLVGIYIAQLYRFTRRGVGSGAAFQATLVLLTILVAFVTQVIGNNVAAAFSLVGTLSIVRFRTVVRDTKDTSYVIFAVVVGMAMGGGQALGALCGIAIVSLAAWLYRDHDASGLASLRDLKLRIRITWSEVADNAVKETLSLYATDLVVVSAETARHGAALELTYRGKLKPDVSAAPLVAALNRVEGVQEVELQLQADQE